MGIYCYIFHYSMPGLYKIELTDEEQELEAEDLLYKHGLKPDECAWMFTNKELEIEQLSE